MSATTKLKQWGISRRSREIQRCHSFTVKRIGGGACYCYARSLQFLWAWTWWWGDPDIGDQQ